MKYLLILLLFTGGEHPEIRSGIKQTDTLEQCKAEAQAFVAEVPAHAPGMLALAHCIKDDTVDVSLQSAPDPNTKGTSDNHN